MEVETLQTRQKGICPSCRKSFMNGVDQGGLKCWKCDQLYCNRCYARDHAQHNMELWSDKN